MIYSYKFLIPLRGTITNNNAGKIYKIVRNFNVGAPEKKK